MTDQQSYYMLDGTPLLTIERQDTLAADLLIKLPVVSDHDSVRISPHRLLAMIDTIDPDAMRAYLLETVPEADSPEADSPEDVDEHPDPVEQMRESGRQLGEAWRALSDAFREASKGSNR